MPVASMSRGKVDEMLASLERQGATVERMGTGRRVVFPNGRSVPIHDSPSDVNWINHVRRAVTQAGLAFPLTDSKAAKAAEKAYRNPSFGPSIPDTGEGFEVPEGPLEHKVVPPGVRALAGRRPIDRSIGLVRGAVHNLGPNKKTFWTAEVSDQLKNFVGFRSTTANNGGAGIQRAQGILDWLGYRVVEARPNRNGYIYRWAMDPAHDRSKQETLPLLVPTEVDPETVAQSFGATTLVDPPKPLEKEITLDDVTPRATDVGGGVPETDGVSGGTGGAVSVEPSVPQAVAPKPQPPKPTAPVAAVPRSDVPAVAEPAPQVAERGLPARVPASASTSDDVDAARALLDDAGSWAVSLDTMGKAGARLEKMIKSLGLQGELRVWRR